MQKTAIAAEEKIINKILSSFLSDVVT